MIEEPRSKTPEESLENLFEIAGRTGGKPEYYSYLEGLNVPSSRVSRAGDSIFDGEGNLSFDAMDCDAEDVSSESESGFVSTGSDSDEFSEDPMECDSPMVCEEKAPASSNSTQYITQSLEQCPSPVSVENIAPRENVSSGKSWKPLRSKEGYSFRRERENTNTSSEKSLRTHGYNLRGLGAPVVGLKGKSRTFSR